MASVFHRTQGTGAMISAALAICNYFKLEAPHVLVAGDIGDGKGTRDIYKYLTEHVVELAPEVITMHYSLPIMALLKKLCETIKGCQKRPFMIADAGAMYAAKGAGLAAEFDIFTPDPSEIAFLADPQATHPAYISHSSFRLRDADKIPRPDCRCLQEQERGQIAAGERQKRINVAVDGQILATINEPNVPTLEPIGGTGDTITGLVSGLVYAGLEPKDARYLRLSHQPHRGDAGPAYPSHQGKRDNRPVPHRRQAEFLLMERRLATTMPANKERLCLK